MQFASSPGNQYVSTCQRPSHGSDLIGEVFGVDVTKVCSSRWAQIKIQLQLDRKTSERAQHQRQSNTQSQSMPVRSP